MRVHLYGHPELSIEVDGLVHDECASCIAVHMHGKGPGVYFIQQPDQLRRVEVCDDGMQVMVCEPVTAEEAEREIAASKARVN